eukprot:306071-Pleurochrysis_carterae.AAC.1
MDWSFCQLVSVVGFGLSSFEFASLGSCQVARLPRQIVLSFDRRIPALGAQISQMRALVEAVWDVFDTEGTGRVSKKV